VLDQQLGAATRWLHGEDAGPTASSRGRPRRILHVLAGFACGGIEIWLLNVLRATDRARYPMDFLVLTDQPGACEEVRALGGRVIACPHPRRPWLAARRFREILRTQGPYAVVHSHVHHYSGFLMRLAADAGVPVRVAHSHNDTRVVEKHASWRRRFYLGLMKRWIRRFATHRIAVSRSAAEDLFGPDWSSDRRCRVIACGIDFAAFAGADCRVAMRQSLGLAEDALVIGHVGRFQERKNHRFLLEIAAQVFARDPDARLLLVGEGELRPVIEARAAELRMADRVVFTGARADVAALMQAMDVFVFPSHHEGLGLVLLEAQATGLPSLMADHLPAAAIVLPQLIHRLSLKAPAAKWAECVLQIAGRAPIRRDSALKAMSKSEFSIQRSVVRLLQVYEMSPTG
jgi:glycosyltransferase involved in cell wall biosynthesis